MHATERDDLILELLTEQGFASLQQLCERLGASPATVRGRAGGYRLAKEPGQINLGWLIRQTEPDFHLVECFDRANDKCSITPACRLKNVLMEATKSFLAVLDRYTLADFPSSPTDGLRLIQLWADRQALSAAG